jgi:hypothetical protein
MIKGVLKTIKRHSISGGERVHSSSRPHPASDAITREVRGKQATPSKGLSRESYNGMDGRKGKRVENGDERKVRISQRLEDKPEIGLYYILRPNIRICINGKSV